MCKDEGDERLARGFMKELELRVSPPWDPFLLDLVILRREDKQQALSNAAARRHAGAMTGSEKATGLARQERTVDGRGS